MFKQLTPLSAESHRDLLFSPNQPFDFARELVLIPLTAAELFKAARELTIVFPIQGGVPQALVGYEAGNNVHINETGHWIGRYIPAHLRRYPFILREITTTEADRAETGRRFSLQVDIEAPHLSAPSGHRLFDAQGQPTDMLRRIQQILMHLQADSERTQAMVTKLESYNLLMEQSVKINPPNGESKLISGFRVVNTKSFAELPVDQLAELRSSGGLAMIYAHMVSLTNLEDGWIAKVAATATPNIPKDEGETFSFENIDWNKLFPQ